MKKIVFLLAFVSMGIFANASNGGLIHLDPVKLVEPVKPVNEIKMYEEVGYEFENQIISFDETTCVTVSYVCAESPNGSGHGSCTHCSTSASAALAAATACATYYELMFCPAP